MSQPLLQVQLAAFYGRTPVLQDVRFEIRPGEALGLIGTSGAGKSTLLMAMLGLLPWKGGACKGEVLFEGVNLLSLREPEARRLRGNRIALIPQSPAAALNGSISLRTHFEQAWKAHEGVRADLDTRLRELMAQVKLPASREFLGRKPGEISFGQGQRVLIALALLHRPALILADEPTSALDTVNQAEIVALLRSLAAMGTALLYISHDLLSVLQLCRRVAILDQGSIVECLAVDRIVESAKHPATLAMLGALQVPSALLRQLGGGPPLVSDRVLESTPARQMIQVAGVPAENTFRPSWFPAGRR